MQLTTRLTLGDAIWLRTVITRADLICSVRILAVWENSIYDLADYQYTISLHPGADAFNFLNPDITDLFKERAGQDITKDLNKVLAGLDQDTRDKNVNCLKNMFFVGETDFRKTARCQVQNIILLVFSAILMASMGLKCMSPYPLFVLIATLIIFHSLVCLAVVSQAQSGNVG